MGEGDGRVSALVDYYHDWLEDVLDAGPELEDVDSRFAGYVGALVQLRDGMEDPHEIRELLWCLASARRARRRELVELRGVQSFVRVTGFAW